MNAPKPIRVLVVDDSAFMRRAISSMIEKQPDMQVVGKAHNGLQAVEMARSLEPDAITLDIEMPEMDGLTALRRIKRFSPAAVLMVSSLTTDGSVAALSALRAGASDFIAKEVSQISLDVVKIEQDLVAKLRAITQKRHIPRPAVGGLARLPLHEPLHLQPSSLDCIVIGSSTGGPPVLECLLGAITSPLPLPIVIAQHMPYVFTQSMAERLNELSAQTVVLGEHGMPLVPGCAYVAPGGRHTRIRKAAANRYRLEVSDHPAEALYKPSVNELFRSAARSCGRRCLAIVLTGMGDDGLEGGRELAQAKATLIAQEPASCVVYGMPKAVTQAGLIHAQLTPEQIAQVLAEMCSPRADKNPLSPVRP